MKTLGKEKLRLPAVNRASFGALGPEATMIGGAAACEAASADCISECRFASVIPTGSARMESIHSFVKRIAISDAPVLLQGESGVGKEVLARQLHASSLRAGKPFLKLNCAALPSELLESELFGYERGAFTGAYKSTAGKFEAATGGTILLDEIGDMDVRLQAKLLHVLQDHAFQRLGGRETICVDVRLIAATHCNLQRAIHEGRFRQDLYYRLNVIRVDIPPLRERKGEIPSLAKFFLEKHALPGAPCPQLTPDLLQALLNYDWPGNIRELENAMHRLLVIQDQGALIRELSMNLRRSESAGTGLPLIQPVFQHAGNNDSGHGSAFERAEQSKAEMEAEAICAALHAKAGNRRKAALLLGVKYKALLYKMKKLGITVDSD